MSAQSHNVCIVYEPELNDRPFSRSQAPGTGGCGNFQEPVSRVGRMRCIFSHLTRMRPYAGAQGGPESGHFGPDLKQVFAKIFPKTEANLCSGPHT